MSAIKFIYDYYEDYAVYPLKKVSRVTVDNEVFMITWVEKKIIKRRYIMKIKVIEFISLQELAKYLGVEIYYDESKFKPYTLRVKEN